MCSATRTARSRRRAEQGQAVGIERGHTRSQPVPVRVGLDHGEHLRIRRARAYLREIARNAARLTWATMGEPWMGRECAVCGGGSARLPRRAHGPRRLFRPSRMWYKTRAQERTKIVRTFPRRRVGGAIRAFPEDDETRLLHHHGGAVLLVARRQRAAGRGHRAAGDLQEPGVDDAVAQVLLLVSYVALAPFVGAFADSMPKGRVMFITNTVKIVGCALMLFGAAPAARPTRSSASAPRPTRRPSTASSPSTCRTQQLVVANGWIEGLTVASIILGTLLGGVLIGPQVSGGAAAASTCPHRDRDRHRRRKRRSRDHRLFYVDRGALQLVHPGHRRRPPRC